MVKVKGLTVESIENGIRYVEVSLKADTRAEVDACGNSGAGVIGLMDSDVMILGSTAMCADGNFGMITSTGVWNW